MAHTPCCKATPPRNSIHANLLIAKALGGLGVSLTSPIIGLAEYLLIFSNNIPVNQLYIRRPQMLNYKYDDWVGLACTN